MYVRDDRPSGDTAPPAVWFQYSANRKGEHPVRLSDLKEWFDTTLSQVSAKSPMALAIGYSLSNRTAPTRFVDDGRIEAHNNAAERAAIGRKNCLHLGSDRGGHSAAVIYTLVGAAGLNDIDAQAYLRHMLERIAEHPSKRIDELLPWAVAGELAKLAPTSEFCAIGIN